MKNATHVLLAILIVAIVAGFVAIVAIFKLPTEIRTIETTGNAELEVLPSQAIVYLGYKNTNATAQIAEQENAKVVNAIKEALSGIEIETDYYLIEPNYNWSDWGRQEIISYTATHRLKLIIKNLSVGQWITAAVQAGANFVDSIEYDLNESEKNALKAEALRQASEAARAKADAVASGLGVKILAIKSVTDTSWEWFPWIRAINYESGKPMPTIPAPIEVGKVRITANVRVVFEIG
jgi:uncharacterized protein YggE